MPNPRRPKYMKSRDTEPPTERSRAPRTVVLVAVLLVVLAACSTDDGDGGGTAEPDDQTPTGNWVLVAGTVDGVDILPPDTHRITLDIGADGSVGGTAACNSYGGSIDVGGDTLAITGLEWTEMACDPPSVMDAEQRYLTGITEVDRFTMTEAGLVLTGGDTVSFEFAPVPEVDDAALLDTTWVLDTLIDGDTASSVSGEPALLVLTTDGRIEGSTGCREIIGTYTVSGDEILATDLGALGSCNSRLIPQDGLVLDVLGDGFTALVEGDVLTLGSSGGVGLRYISADRFSH